MCSAEKVEGGLADKDDEPEARPSPGFDQTLCPGPRLPPNQAAVPAPLHTLPAGLGHLPPESRKARPGLPGPGRKGSTETF